MVKQELATPQGAASLYERALDVRLLPLLFLFLLSLYLHLTLFCRLMNLPLSPVSMSFYSISLSHFTTHPASPLQTCRQGDALVDAAIEAYAADRDVTEFLDTLQILSSHTPEGEGCCAVISVLLRLIAVTLNSYRIRNNL
jgi:hypothetical protein